ncbi:hypothetical protein [Acidaminococcus sp.]|uniref:hypothetical protein n=1 Tax=Acidaminococcus sp. TaxID=1872103 RepID=UPI003D7D2F33
MPNSFSNATIFQTALDRQILQNATSSFLEANAGQVKYNGGDTVKIPVITTDGLADYDRSTGYPSGAVTLTYEDKKMTQDRAQSFNIDAIDVDETNYVANVANVMGVFQREKVIPEIDLYRWNKIFLAASGANHSTAKILTKATILDELEADINAVEDVAGTREGLVIVMNTKVSSARMNTIVTKDGSTKAMSGTGKAINWLVFPQSAPIAVSKTDTVRIFSPNGEAGYPAFQGANAWHVDYRKFHDLWIPDKRLDVIFAHCDPTD